MDIVNIIYIVVLGVVATTSYIFGKRVYKGDMAIRNNEILKKYDKIQSDKVSKEELYKEDKWKS